MGRDSVGRVEFSRKALIKPVRKPVEIVGALSSYYLNYESLLYIYWFRLSLKLVRYWKQR